MLWTLDLARHRRRLLATALWLPAACGRPATDPEARARAIEDPAELEAMESAPRSRPKRSPTPKWKRAAPPMPETFSAFERPELARLDGAWLVASEIPGQRVLWLVEEAGSKLTEVDHRGRERVFGLSLASPCALRLTDDRGHTRTRVLAMREPALGDPGAPRPPVQFVSPQPGATAIAGRDGSMLACVGYKTYQIAADGRCRYTSEMLGTWTEPTTPSEACALSKDEAGRVLVIAEQRLREEDGLWVAQDLELARATWVEDRAAGLARLAEPKPEPVPEAETGTETETETSSAAEGE